MLRKFSCLLLIAYICLFTSCITDAKDKNSIKVGFSQCISGDAWRDAMEYTMRLEASLNPNVELTVFNANRDVNKQIKQIESMIEKDLDVIIISPFDSKSLTSVLDKAFSKGIPVILLDRKVNSTSYTAYIGTDNIEVGQLAGKYLASLSNGKGVVLEVRGNPNTSPGLDRSIGFHKVISQFPGIKVISLVSKNDQLPQAEFNKIIEQNPNINYVFAYNDIIAYQVWQAAKKKEFENKIKIIGVDGLNGPSGGVQLVKDKIITATVLYPTGGAEAIKLALRICNKEIVPKHNELNTVLIDSINADILSNQFDRITVQQSNIESQLNVIKDQEEKYITLYNLIKLLSFFLVIIFCLAVFSIYSVITIRNKKRLLEVNNYKITSQKNEIEKFVEKLKESNESKINFFTGISHEFKTPLTLILSSVESLHDEFQNKSNTVKKDLDIMYNNSMRLLRLINQLLDFRKVEDKKFTIKLSKNNLWKFSVNMFKEFKREAKKRNINYTIETDNEEIEVYFDVNLMDKVYYNLLSNCFKFTPDGGEIAVRITQNTKNGFVKISFKDSGIGIPEKEIKQVFSPFFQGTNNYRNGSGIGLNLSKSFIDLHQGIIEVKSVNGAEFSVYLKLGESHLNKADIVNSSYHSFVTDENEYEYLENEFSLSNESLIVENKQSLLIVEDNIDLLDFMYSKLKEEYIVTKCNGEKAIEKALELMPDIVVCDLNLPERNGFEICETLKKNMITSHIPVIILTAMDDSSTYLKSLEVGADLFLTKPFNFKVLKHSIKGLLFNREKLRYYYTNNIDKIESDSLSLIEKEFLNKINVILENNIDNSSFSVEELASNLNISRVQLYRKVKGVLGIGVGDYINNFRLDKAQILLNTTAMNISEIAYSCGFASPNYFSTAFKTKFGVTPKDYRNN
ncbi:ABC-type sugar transport system, substrate-binding protein, contains N-terminal xre family HTH domain [Flavobacterium flevense]|nr:substrate-binding domain-containing protein [Flavobacterium flevense]SHL71256.1 ABC-type sugar transport system, substrate-binding protein, contains N-terminal xre family HTH domain [Flavobacterium flevense]